MTKTNILAIIKYLLEIIAGKLSGKADKEHTHSEATTTAPGFLSVADKKTFDAIPDTYAKKSDIVNVYRYKGSVSTFDELPKTNVENGDVYNVGTDNDGMNYAWTGTAWDALGGSFAMEEITEGDLDQICAEVWGE